MCILSDELKIAKQKFNLMPNKDRRKTNNYENFWRNSYSRRI